MKELILSCGFLLLLSASVQGWKTLATMKRYNHLRSAPPGNWAERDFQPHHGRIPNRRKSLDSLYMPKQQSNSFQGRKRRRSGSIKPLLLPKNFDSDHLQIPNPRFCANMRLNPSNQYFVLPWWYDYCKKIYDKEVKEYDRNEVFYLPAYKQVLDKLRDYEKNRRYRTKRT